LLIDRANLLTLTAPEMTVLIGGMRVLNTNYDHSEHGVFTTRQGVLTNDFFTNLLDLGTTWKSSNEKQTLFKGSDRKTGEIKMDRNTSRSYFGSNSELRALAEVYGSSDSEKKFVKDFASAWNKS